MWLKRVHVTSEVFHDPDVGSVRHSGITDPDIAEPGDFSVTDPSLSQSLPDATSCLASQLSGNRFESSLFFDPQHDAAISLFHLLRRAGLEKLEVRALAPHVGAGSRLLALGANGDLAEAGKFPFQEFRVSNVRVSPLVENHEQMIEVDRRPALRRDAMLPEILISHVANNARRRQESFVGPIAKRTSSHYPPERCQN